MAGVLLAFRMAGENLVDACSTSDSGTKHCIVDVKLQVETKQTSHMPELPRISGKHGGSAQKGLGWSACLPKNSSLREGQALHILCLVSAPHGDGPVN